MDKRKVCNLVPCCGQDGYRAQVPQHHSYRYISHTTSIFNTGIQNKDILVRSVTAGKE